MNPKLLQMLLNCSANKMPSSMDIDGSTRVSIKSFQKCAREGKYKGGPLAGRPGKGSPPYTCLPGHTFERICLKNLHFEPPASVIFGLADRPTGWEGQRSKTKQPNLLSRLRGFMDTPRISQRDPKLYPSETPTSPG